MIGIMLRLGWRIFVAGVAIGLAYGVIFLFYPYLDNHLPLLVNLVIIYIIAAYLAIPFLVRLWHLILKPHHVPHYAVSGDGWSSDPVNLVIICRDKQQLQRTMERAGWHMADRPTIHNSLRLAFAIVCKRPYPTAPFSNLYLFGRKQDIGFQIQTGTPATPRHRHHVRFWRVRVESRKPHQHTTFWRNILQLFAGKKKQIWVGAATHDIGAFAFRVRNLQLTHQIDEKTDKERDFVIASLKDITAVRRQRTIATGKPLQFRGQTFGVNITTDGTLQAIELMK